MRRLLCIALRSPVSTWAGNSLILRNHLEHLGARHEVDLVAFGTKSDRDDARLNRWCARVVMVPPEPGLVRRVAQLRGMALGRPRGVSHYASPAMHHAVNLLVAERQYDATVAHLCEAAQFRPARHGGALILDAEDPPSIKVARTIPWLPARRRLAARYDRRTMRAYERACVAAFDRIVFVNPRDAAEFAAFHGCPEKVAHVTHAVADDMLRVRPAGRKEQLIIVTGNMAHPPNVAGVQFFCTHVLPRVRQTLPSAELWLVGASPAPSVLAWASTPGIRVTGAVPDIAEYLVQARVSVCAVPVVIGTQTKILEALACGTPVVTTSPGNYGLDAVDGEHLYIADDPALFADRVVGLLRGEQWNEMSLAGRRLVKDRFTPARASAELERVIEAAIASPRFREAAGRCGPVVNLGN